MPTRYAYLLGAITTTTLLLISLYLQFYEGFIPCPLCTLQRFSFAALAVLFLIGFFLSSNRLARFFVNVSALIMSSLGMLFAGRQIWLQHFPTEDSAECGVGIQYMMQVLPLHEVVQKIFSGTAECAQPGWSFLSLSMADWTFIWFALFLILSIYLIFKKKYSN